MNNQADSDIDTGDDLCINSTATVPESATTEILFGIGLVGLAGTRPRRTKK